MIPLYQDTFVRISKRFEEFGFPLVVDTSIVPDDETTLFVCSGMQRVRKNFTSMVGGHHGSLQSCVRMNDLDLVGDGIHLTSFGMIGNFSFGENDFPVSVDLWHSILTDFAIPVDCIHVHPSRDDHKRLWLQHGYTIVDDLECIWSDGDIGGHCCEVYSNGVEIGNLVNPQNTSTDVGFGWERLNMIIEQKDRVDHTSLFDQSLHPIVSDHANTVKLFWANNIQPGNKHREYVCRRLLRRMIPYLNGTEQFVFDEWLRKEESLRQRCISKAKCAWRRFKDKSDYWWWDTFGVLPEELRSLGE